jgi:hypothetical protein
MSYSLVSSPILNYMINIDGSLYVESKVNNTPNVPALPEFGSLPSAIFFVECFISGTRQRALCRVPCKKPSVKENTRRRSSLPSVLFLHSAKGSLPSVTNTTLGKELFAECFFYNTRQRQFKNHILK